MFPLPLELRSRWRRSSRYVRSASRRHGVVLALAAAILTLAVEDHARAETGPPTSTPTPETVDDPTALGIPSPTAAPGPAPARRRDLDLVERQVAFPTGLAIGWLGVDGVHAVAVGLEVSVVWYVEDRASLLPGPADGSVAYGLVAEAAWISEPSHFRAYVGTELMGFFSEAAWAGAETGLTIHSSGEPLGFRVRGFVSWYWPAFYFGVDYHGRVAMEAGLLLKIPLTM